MGRVLRMAADQADHEELFMERYVRLFGWALHLSGSDKGKAEDLVHDAYIQFTLGRPDLDLIHNLDAYLFGMLRNLHLANLRRAARRSDRELSLADYDAVSIALRTVDPSDRLHLRRELHRICQYACARKETSKAGSVLLLRFFLGYYPSELAQIMKGSRPAVEERLRLARAEVKAYLKDPGSFKVIGTELSGEEAPAIEGSTSEDIQRDLYRQILNSRRGDCLTLAQWQSVYQKPDSPALSCGTFAHLASCHDCLDQVNDLLGLPPLAERHPFDTLGSETRPRRKNGGDDGGNDDGEGPEGGGGISSPREQLKRCRRRAREVFHHRPRELCVAVNGEIAGTQSIGAEHNEQTLHLSEEIDFVELLSEQGVRLLLVSVDTQPPQGPVRHQAWVRLSGDREVKLQLDLGHPNSLLQVTYDDPTWAEQLPDSVAEPALATGPKKVRSNAPAAVPPLLNADNPVGLFAQYLQRLKGLWQALTVIGLRPAGITALTALLLIATVVFLHFRTPPVSAADLLHRSLAADLATAKNSSAVIHRTVYLEERKHSSAAAATKRRVEDWQSVSAGIAVRKVYDEKNQLVIGEVIKGDGTRLLLPAEQEAPTTGLPPRDAHECLQAGAFWRVDPSAADFLSLIGSAEAAQVEEQTDRFLLHFSGNAIPSELNLLAATLTLKKPDLRSTELKLTIQRAGETWEYHWTESSLTLEKGIDPAVLQAGAGQLNDAAANHPASVSRVSAADLKGAPAVTATASAELEVEINYLLDQVKANLGEQVSLTRSADNQLHLSALVETESRKAQILGALRPVANNPAVHLNVVTVSEAIRDSAQNAGAPTTVKEVAVEQNGFQGSDLRRYFLARSHGDEAAADLALRQFCTRMMSYSRQAVQHAAALKKLVNDFPLDRSRSLDADAKTKFLSMIASHAAEYRRNVSYLREGLRQIAPAPAAAVTAATVIGNDQALPQAVERLLRLSYAEDTAVRSALALSDQSQSLDSIKSDRFWAELAAADRLVLTIENTYRR